MAEATAVDPAALVANPRNWRLHPEHQQEAVASVLDEIGWVQDVIVNRTTGFVLDGHLRVALAVQRQEPLVPVKYVELSEEEERLVLATLDPLSAAAEQDDEKLHDLLQGLTAEGPIADLFMALDPLQVPVAVFAAGEVPAPAPRQPRSEYIELTCPECSHDIRFKRSDIKRRNGRGDSSSAP
jgi:hypothetical protein